MNISLPQVTEKERYFQCDARRGTSCGYIENKLKTRHLVALNECNICFDLGGLYSEKAREWRDNYYRTLISNLINQDLKQYNPEVIINLLEHHCTLNEGRRILLDTATFIGEESALKLSIRFDSTEDIKVLFSKLSEDEKIQQLHYSLRWTPEISESFKEAEEVEQWNLAQQGLYFISSILSGKNASQEELKDRYLSCFGIDIDSNQQIKEMCPSARESQFSGYFCSDCGCGDTKRANLKKKLHYKKLMCPRRRKGFNNSKG